MGTLPFELSCFLPGNYRVITGILPEFYPVPPIWARVTVKCTIAVKLPPSPLFTCLPSCTQPYRSTKISSYGSTRPPSCRRHQASRCRPRAATATLLLPMPPAQPTLPPLPPSWPLPPCCHRVSAATTVPFVSIVILVAVIVVVSVLLVDC